MPALAATARATPASGIRAVFHAARAARDAGRPVIELFVGEPDALPAPHVVAAAEAAYRAGRVRYTSNGGLPELRAAAAADLQRRHGVPTAAEQVVVTAGGMQALHLALAVLAGPGAEVLVPDPGWPNTAMACELVGARPVRYPLDPARGFRPDPAALAALVTPRTAALVVNSPSNPLGTVLPAEDVEALVALARERDLWLVSDECYDALVHPGAEHVPPRRHDDRGADGLAGRVVGVHTTSKTHAMTGVRVGWLVAPRAVADTAVRVQEAVVSCVNEPAQLAAVAALTGPQDGVAAAVARYTARRDAAVALLDAAGVRCVRPQGAFYLWVEVAPLLAAGEGVADWALRMVAERGVAVAPGSAFGPGGAGWARVSLASATEDVLEGLRRLVA